MSLDDAGSARVAPFVSSLTEPIYVVLGLPEATSARLLAASVGADLRSELARGSGGASSGAEHAAMHLVLEGVSRLAASVLVDLRPGVCTVRSGPVDRRGYVEPSGLPPELAARYREGMDRLLGTYLDLLPRVTEALRVRSSRVAPASDGEHAAGLLRGLLPFVAIRDETAVRQSTGRRRLIRSDLVARVTPAGVNVHFHVRHPVV